MWTAPSDKTIQAALQLAEEELHFEATGLKGSLVRLEPYTWCILRNTESNNSFSIAEFEKVAKEQGWVTDQMIRRFRLKLSVEAPVIVETPGERPWLASGDIQLSLCRALGIQPSVWCIRVGKANMNYERRRKAS